MKNKIIIAILVFSHILCGLMGYSIGMIRNISAHKSQITIPTEAATEENTACTIFEEITEQTMPTEGTTETTEYIEEPTEETQSPDIPVYTPVVTTPPNTNPSATEPPTTQPPATEPPATEVPPVTETPNPGGNGGNDTAYDEI